MLERQPTAVKTNKKDATRLVDYAYDVRYCEYMLVAAQMLKLGSCFCKELNRSSFPLYVQSVGWKNRR